MSPRNDNRSGGSNRGCLHFKTIKRGLPEILNYIRNFREQIRVRVRLSFLYVVDPCHTGHVLQP